MASVRVVLVRPENSANVGACARVVRNRGLAEANARGWTVVSIKDDWKGVFGFDAWL